MLKELFGFGRAALEHQTQRDAEKNAPDVKAAKISANEQEATDKINQNVAKGKIDEIRKDIAE